MAAVTPPLLVFFMGPWFSPSLCPPQLQKSAVLQKTIDYIRYLEKNVKILHEENQQLRQTLGKGMCGEEACVGVYV